MDKKESIDDKISQLEKYAYDTNINGDLVADTIKKERSRIYRARYLAKKSFAS